MPKIERNRPVDFESPAPQFNAGLATTPRPTVVGERSFPQSALSGALGPRQQTSSVALPQARSFMPLRQGLSAVPVPARNDRPRDVAVASWRDRAGPSFDQQQYEQAMLAFYGADYRFRPDDYESDSEGSDFDDIPPTNLTALDPGARAERFQHETAALFARHDDLLLRHRQTPFSQADYLQRVEPDCPGACLALSVRWLQSAQADPGQSAPQRLGFIASNQQAQSVIELQGQSNRLHIELAFRTYHPLKELSETSQHLQGVEFDRYVTFKADEGTTLSDVGLQAAMRLRHELTSRHHLLIPLPNAHAIACEKLDDGRFRLFEPNHGVYEAEPERLDELLAGILARHVKQTKFTEDRKSGRDVPIAELVAKMELKIVPVRISSEGTNSGSGANGR